jgi:hypothetical protein
MLVPNITALFITLTYANLFPQRVYKLCSLFDLIQTLPLIPCNLNNETQCILHYVTWKENGREKEN